MSRTLISVVKIKKLTSISVTCDVHTAIAADLHLAWLSFEFKELACYSQITSKPLPGPELVKCLSSSQHYPNLLATLARILAAKPHSADVERCISANNLLKTSLRASLDIATESRYLFVHHNLHLTAEWNARQAVLHWLQEKHRRAKMPTKSKSQAYFHHVYKEATDSHICCCCRRWWRRTC